MADANVNVNSHTDPAHRQDLERRLFRLVQLQFVASIFIGIAIISAVVWLGNGETTKADTLKTLKDWGGIVMGFFFGSMFTQTQALIESFKK